MVGEGCGRGRTSLQVDPGSEAREKVFQPRSVLPNQLSLPILNSYDFPLVPFRMKEVRKDRSQSVVGQEGGPHGSEEALMKASVCKNQSGEPGEQARAIYIE